MCFMIAAPDAYDLTIGERVERLAHNARALDLMRLFLAGDAAKVASSLEFQDLGYCSPLDWLKREMKLRAGEAADIICVGEQMEAIGESADAMAEGEIGFAHLAEIARAAEALRTSPTARGFDERRLLERAKVEDSLTSFGTFCLKYRHTMDPEAYVNEELEGVEARKLEISGAGNGMVFIKGMLDPEGGAALGTALEPLARKSGKDDVRERDRRVADALIDLARRQLDSGTLPSRDGGRPHLQVMAPLDTLLGLPGAPAADMEFSLPTPPRATTARGPQLDRAGRLRLLHHPRPPRLRLRAHRRRSSQAHRPPLAAQGPEGARSALRVARLRPAGELHECAPRRALDPRRAHRARQSRPPLLSPSPPGS